MSCLGVTGELGKESKYEWKKSNFFFLSATKGSYYKSPSFVFANVSFHLRIYPVGLADAKSGFASVALVNEGDNPFHMNIALHVKKADGTMIVIGAGDIIDNFFQKCSLQQNNCKLKPLDIQSIICILKLNQDEKQDTKKAVEIEDLQVKQTHKISDYKCLTELDVLSENLKDLSTNKDSCDTVLQVKEKEFKAHKAILMARSSVFSAMFQHDTLEKQTGFVKIPDCDPESFQEFLDYLYCGKLQAISYHCAFQLYITSNKYDVEKLKEFCIEYLIKSLTPDNVCEIVKLADKYDEEKLLSAAQHFFIENWNQILQTTEWKNLMKNDYRLAHKLLIEFSKTKESQ